VQQMLMCDTYVESGCVGKVRSFQDATVPNRETVCGSCK
jgi:hypothetical protein